MTTENDWLVFMNVGMKHAEENGFLETIVKIFGDGVRDMYVKGNIEGEEIITTEIAKKCKAKEIPVDIIGECTGLSVDKINSL